VVLLRNLNNRKAYNLALVTTDLTAAPEQIIARYADRWSIEQSFKDSKDHLGVGDDQNRLPTAVGRTVPFGLLTLTIGVCWYHYAGRVAADITARRAIAPWYRYKRTSAITVTDMPTAFCRTRIAAIAAGPTTPNLTAHSCPTCTVTA
jgi:hypothetical protein